MFVTGEAESGLLTLPVAFLALLKPEFRAGNGIYYSGHWPMDY